MPETAEAGARRKPAMLYRRIEAKLGLSPLGSDQDIARLVDSRLPLSSLESLVTHGVTNQEIFSFILPRRTLAHRKSRLEPLSHEESDRAVRIARITSLAEEVFGEEDKAGRWLRKPKARFEGRTPFELLRTEAGARLVEELLLQFEYGFVF